MSRPTKKNAIQASPHQDANVENVERLNRMVGELISGQDPKKQLELAQSAREMARHLAYERGEAYALLFLGFAHRFMSEHEVALENLVEARSLFDKIGDREGSMKVLLPFLSIQKSLGTYDQSLSHNLKGL